MSIIHSVSHFESARDAAKPLDRVEDVRAAAEDFRKTMLANPKVKFYNGDGPCLFAKCLCLER